MASVKSLVRTLVKPILFKLMGKSGYKYAQLYGKLRDIEHRLVEEKEMALLPLILNEGDEVLDIGANYAYYTERMSRIVGNTGKVYSFEPIPFTHDVCKMIIEKLKLKNVSLFEKGVAESNKKIRFSVPRLDFGGISAGQAHISGRTIDDSKKKDYYNFDSEEMIECEVISIDSFLLNQLRNVTFVKIDIEGAEFFALQGMQNTLHTFKPILLLEIQPTFLQGFNIDPIVFKKYLTQSLDYIIFTFDNQTKKLTAYLKEDFEDDNYILIHSKNIDKYNHLIN